MAAEQSRAGELQPIAESCPKTDFTNKVLLKAASTTH